MFEVCTKLMLKSNVNSICKIKTFITTWKQKKLYRLLNCYSSWGPFVNVTQKTLSHLAERVLGVSLIENLIIDWYEAEDTYSNWFHFRMRFLLCSIALLTVWNDIIASAAFYVRNNWLWQFLSDPWFALPLDY